MGKAAHYVLKVQLNQLFTVHHCVLFDLVTLYYNSPQLWMMNSLRCLALKARTSHWTSRAD